MIGEINTRSREDLKKSDIDRAKFKRWNKQDAEGIAEAEAMRQEGTWCSRN